MNDFQFILFFTLFVVFSLLFFFMPKSSPLCYSKEFMYPLNPSISSLRSTRFLNSMKLISLFVAVLMMVVVSGDDTQAFRNTISSLCSLNKVGPFASCCGSYDNGASLTLKNTPATSCFVSRLMVSGDSILTGLFAFPQSS